MTKRSEEIPESPDPRPPRSGEVREPPSLGARDVALDAFRGLSIAAMILVNTPGRSVHPFAALRHASWSGWRAADLIFPAFLFIVGVAIWLSIGRSVERGAPRPHLGGRIVRRALLIFALGLFLNAFPDFDWWDVRIPGILQRIALCYLLASIVVLKAGTRGTLCAALGLLGLETAVLASGSFQSPDANAGAALDRLLLHRHLLHAGWDPEGMLGTLGATATTLGGVLAGRFWVRPGPPVRRAAVLVATGVACAIGGLALSPWVPINKSLWTASYALFTLGTSLIVLALCSWLIDVRGWLAWAKPFVVYGRNPLAAYVLSVLVDKSLRTFTVAMPDGTSMSLRELVYGVMFAGTMPEPAASLAYSVAYVLIWLIPLTLLQRHRIFIKI